MFKVNRGYIWRPCLKIKKKKKNPKALLMEKLKHATLKLQS